MLAQEMLRILKHVKMEIYAPLLYLTALYPSVEEVV
jgi:hypothetical protein